MLQLSRPCSVARPRLASLAMPSCTPQFGYLRPCVVRADKPGQEPVTGAPTASPPKLEKLDDLPPWVRREKERQIQAQEGSKGLPWALYLLFSSFVAIAAVGSVFEYNDQNPIFGVIGPDSPIYAPILLGMAVSGWPTAGLLFYKGVTGFNEEAEKQDRLDGYK